MNSIEKRIIETADELKEDILDFACRLIQEPSTLGNEYSALKVMESELKKLDFKPVKVKIDPDKLNDHPGYAYMPNKMMNRYNIVARKEGHANDGKSALFNGHLDVVSPEPISYWSRDPFKPVIIGDWLYGRGSGDMKSGVAAMIYAVYAVEKAGFKLRAPVTVEGVIEEECSGNGSLACIVEGYDAEAILIPEPFGPRIMTNQLGIVWFKVTVNGSPTHVLDAKSGTNAIEKCLPLINALKKMESELNKENVPKAYKSVNHPLNLNVGIIKGGDWPSTVPAIAEFHARLSYFPGVSYGQIKKRIIAAIEKESLKDKWLSKNPPEVIFYGFRSEGHSISRYLPAFEVLNNCHKSLTGKNSKERICTGTSDARVFHYYGSGQATCYGPVAENIHAANERVSIKSVQHIARTYSLFLSRWCGIFE